MASFPARVVEVTMALLRGLTAPGVPFSRRVNVLTGFTASGVRLTAGMTVRKPGPRPQQRLILWDFERCPHSRPVREALSTLDLDAEVRPCPRGGTRFRSQLKSARVPQLEDPNSGEVLVGCENIVRHLHTHYGVNKPPGFLNANVVRIVTGIMVRILTGGIGAFARPSRAPEKLLELWSFEASPYSRFVRATLCELELPYILHNVAKDSPRRPEYVARVGKMQVPWLVDPNTGTELFESLAIQKYLEATYGQKPA